MLRLIKTNIDKCYKIITAPKKDNRGYFLRSFCSDELKKLKFNIKQINISFNKDAGTLRGFHYQKLPSREDKIISCIKGEIFNVIYDLRSNSKTFKKLFTIKLKENDFNLMYIPAGCANCFVTLKNNTKIIYYMNDNYKPKKNYGFNYNSEEIKIKWPIKIKKISKTDLNLPKLNNLF